MVVKIDFWKYHHEARDSSFHVSPFACTVQWLVVVAMTGNDLAKKRSNLSSRFDCDKDDQTWLFSVTITNKQIANSDDDSWPNGRTTKKLLLDNGDSCKNSGSDQTCRACSKRRVIKMTSLPRSWQKWWWAGFWRWFRVIDHGNDGGTKVETFFLNCMVS